MLVRFCWCVFLVLVCLCCLGLCLFWGIIMLICWVRFLMVLMKVVVVCFIRKLMVLLCML